MIQHQECLPDDETDLNELTEEQHEKRLADGLARFWASQATEMEALEIGTEQDFKNHNDLPLARIKRIMKSDEDVRMISAEAPVLFAKACEMFILELTLRSNSCAEKSKRRTLQKEDVEASIKVTETYDFLVDLDNA
jgi:histone H3/H4